jgi:hypothetical protein
MIMPGAEIKSPGGDEARRFPSAGGYSRGIGAGGAPRESLLGFDLRVPSETHEQSETLAVGRHRHLSAHEASGKQSVSLARNDAAHVGTACELLQGLEWRHTQSREIVRPSATQ